MKHLHLLLVALVIAVFIARVLLAQFKPDLLQNKWLKIAPHGLAGLLIISGGVLVVQGGWFDLDFGWIVAKIFALLGFIGLGIVAIKSEGDKRWYAFAGALLVFIYIVKVALTKQAFFFVG